MTLRLPHFSIRQILLLITGALTLVIVALTVSDTIADNKRLERTTELRGASNLTSLLFDASDQVALERDLVLTMLSAHDPDAVAALQPRLAQSRVVTDQALNSAVAAFDRYHYMDLLAVRDAIAHEHVVLQLARPDIDRALRLPFSQRSPALTTQWNNQTTALIDETGELWQQFIRRFTDIDATATQHLRYRNLLRTISEYTGRERFIIGRLITQNADPSLEDTATLLRGAGALDLAWTNSRQIAAQSGLFPAVAPVFNDAESHFATMQDMSREMFFLPGARHGQTYLISPDLWYELSEEAAESIQTLRTASRAQINTYLDQLITHMRASIALRLGVLAFSLALSGFVFWIILARVLKPINDTIEALRQATRGEPVTFAPKMRRTDEIAKLADVLEVLQRNVEEIRSTAAELDRSERRLRSIVDFAMDGVVTVGADGLVTSFNPACERMFGYAADEILGRPVRQLAPSMFKGEGRDLSALATGDANRRDSVASHEGVARRRDGALFPIELTVSSYALDGAPHYSAIIRDITLRKRSEQMLVEYTLALERSNKELDDFAYIASHDLKEPLRGIHNHSRFLLEDNSGKLDPDSVGRLDRLIYLSQRMERLVNDLLYFSRLGRQDLAVQRTDIGAVIQDVAGTLDHFLEERRAKLVIAGELPTVVCDKPRVTELFRNLMTNAVKYNDRDEKLVEIGFLSTARTPEGALMRNVFYVRDDGCGIDPEFHTEVFRIFKRLRANKDEGTGVGLTFVKKIVERHGGRIWLESKLGEGATFYFTLEESRDDAKLSPRAA